MFSDGKLCFVNEPRGCVRVYVLCKKKLCTENYVSRMGIFFCAQKAMFCVSKTMFCVRKNYVLCTEKLCFVYRKLMFCARKISFANGKLCFAHRRLWFVCVRKSTLHMKKHMSKHDAHSCNSQKNCGSSGSNIVNKIKPLYQ